MVDVNQEIFIPLQKEMRSVGSGAQEAKSAAPSSAPRTSTSVPSYIPSPPSRPSVPSAGAPLPPKMAMPQPKVAPGITPPPMLPLGEEEKERISNIAPRPPVPPLSHLPGAFQPSVAQSIKRPAPLPSPRPAAPAAHVSVKPYSIDPYREPIDEPRAE